MQTPIIFSLMPLCTESYVLRENCAKQFGQKMCDRTLRTPSMATLLYLVFPHLQLTPSWHQPCGWLAVHFYSAILPGETEAQPTRGLPCWKDHSPAEPVQLFALGTGFPVPTRSHHLCAGSSVYALNVSLLFSGAEDTLCVGRQSVLFPFSPGQKK